MAASREWGQGKSLPPKPDPHEGREDADLVDGNAEHFREHVLVVDDALGGFVEDDFVAVPFGVVACISMGLWVSTGMT